MRASKASRRVLTKQQVPRLRPGEAAQILEECERVLEHSGGLLETLRSTGIEKLLARLDDKTLQLAIQPDSWGERTRACLMSKIAPALGSTSAQGSAVGIDDIVAIANVVVPCLLLEIGRRKHHVYIKFPPNPVDPGSCLKFRAGPSHPLHSISAERLLQLLAVLGADLVGLCYFGDQESRERIEAELSLNAPAKASNSTTCRTSPSPETKH
jgi:hypothetical protein